ncbi:MAG: DUF3368 domain-containing protein [Microscillaceae bacterium]|jgi:hypothetical protein|nr:DUF3368 domain-containing protein [Microscillaceae bacterium]
MLKVISNTTPIITFLGWKRLDILQKLYQQIIIPTGVLEEIETGKAKDFYTDLKQLDWIVIQQVKNTQALNILETELDKGEAEVIILAQEIKADLVILDERLARNYASIKNISYTGSFGVLIKAKQQHIITEVKPFLEQAQNNGIRMNEAVINLILQKANES